MFCPQCGQEFVAGVTVCSDCGVTLQQDPPELEPEPGPEWVDLETVLETGDAALLTVARSLLEAEGIPSFARGEGLQEFMGWGRIPLGVNLVTGPVELQVPPERADEARRLLEATRPDEPEPPEE
jgi:Putative prokaryotic signal transducing protein